MGDGAAQFYRQHPVLIAAGLGVIILGAIFVTWWGLRDTNSAESGAKAFFYDTDTKEVLVRPLTDIPPLPGKNGEPTLVRAVFYSAGDRSAKKLLYLEKYTEEARRAMEKGPVDGTPYEETLAIAAQGRLVRSPKDGSEWVAADSPEGRRLIGRVMEDAGGGATLHPVSPE